STLERELNTLTSNQARGDASVDEITDDLARVRAYAGLEPVAGPGVTIAVEGPIDGPGVEELINELRNAGAEAIAVGDVRMVPGVELTAIGAPDKLTGSLTRSGGVIAQFAVTQPEIVVTVTPVDRVELP